MIIVDDQRTAFKKELYLKIIQNKNAELMCSIFMGIDRHQYLVDCVIIRQTFFYNCDTGTS